MRNSLHCSLFTLSALALAFGAGGTAQAQDAPGAASQPPASTKSEPTAANAAAKLAAAPDLKVEALWDGRKIMPFRSMDTPKMVGMLEATDFLDDADYILGVTFNGQSRAYPTRFIWWHHAINDRIGAPLSGGEIPIAVTYCSVCNTGICYDPVVKDKPVMLDFYGLYNGVVALCDRETESVFLQSEGHFATGALLGTQLKTLPLLDTTWGAWKKLHPDTLVMSPDTPYSRFYNPRGKAEPRGYERFPVPFFRPTVTRGDKRLPPFEKVLAVTVAEPMGRRRATPPVGKPQGAAPDAQSLSTAPVQEPPPLNVLHRAYPLATLQQRGCVINDRLGKTPLAVFLDPDTMTAVAVCRRLDRRTLDFEARKQSDGKLAIYDKQTQSRWNIEGQAEEGPLAGKVLDRVDNHLSQWYGWVAFFPDTGIFGRRDAPQPGDPFATEAVAKPEAAKK